MKLKTKPCPICGSTTILEIPDAEYRAWAIEGKVIQEAMPSLNDDQRELVISGTCPKCWDDFFKEAEASDGEGIDYVSENEYWLDDRDQT